MLSRRAWNRQTWVWCSGNMHRSGDGGLGKAAVMLVVVLAANLLLEDFVEPKVMGRTPGIHPLIVLVVTALGGV
jgi:predicted PurR-regulated permease PerM